MRGRRSYRAYVGSCGAFGVVLFISVATASSGKVVTEARYAPSDSAQRQADSLKQNALYGKVSRTINKIGDAMKRGDSVDVASLRSVQQLILQHGKGPQLPPMYAHMNTQALARNYFYQVGIYLTSDSARNAASAPVIREFITGMQASSDSALRRYGAVRERMLQYQTQPIDLDFRTMDGKSISLASLRGKVVLVDFWSRTCTVCVEAFPKIKALYGELHNQGFEAIGIALGGDADRSTVDNILARHSLPYPQVFTGGKEWDDNSYTPAFCIATVPYMLLLDRQGHVIADGYLDHDFLEAQLPRLLQQKG